MLTVGTVVSGALYVTVSGAGATLFAASRAVTVNTFAPGCSTIPLTDQPVVPVAVPEPPALFVHVTCVTPTLSAAVPLTVTGVVFVRYVPPLVGLVMPSVGIVVSATLYVVVSVDVATLPAASCAVTVS